MEARPEWEEKPGGGRRPSDRQARDERTGMPLWGVEVMYQQTSYGRVASVVGSVTVGAMDQPQVSALGPIAFEGLTVEVRSLKTGGLVENWAAERVAARRVRGASPRVVPDMAGGFGPRVDGVPVGRGVGLRRR